jgi:hypothetical protein
MNCKVQIEQVDMFKNSKDVVVLLIDWSQEGTGFGQIIIKKYPDEQIVIDDEYMGKEFVKEVLNAFIDNVMTD